MLKSVFYPNKTNSYAWVNVLFLIVLVATGKVEAYTILLAYFLETIIIGIFNCVKMYLSYKHNDRQASILRLIPFFIVHYGLFVAIQSVFLFSILSAGKNNIITDPFSIVENFKMALSLEGMSLVLAMLFGTQLMKLFFDFIAPEKHKKFKVQDIMFKPYLRIVIQQFTVIIGGFFMIFSSASILAAMLLIFLRFIVDFVLVAIKEEGLVLDYLVDKIYDGKTSKQELKKKLLFFTE